MHDHNRASRECGLALSGNWYDPATSGQGLTVEVNPISGAFFPAWYTYAPNGAGSGVAGQRWYTAQSLTRYARSMLANTYVERLLP